MLETLENYLPEEEIIPPKKFNLDEFFSGKIFRIGMGILFGFLAILIGITAFNYFLRINNNQPINNQNPTPTVFIPPTLVPSKWATDAAVLKEQENLDKIENDLKNLDLNESTLIFPSLDFNINFKQFP